MGADQDHLARSTRFAEIASISQTLNLKPATVLWSRVNDLCITKLATEQDTRKREALSAISLWDDQQYRKYLRRGHSRYLECLDLICEVFASVDPKVEDLEDKIAEYRRLIWGVSASTPQLQRLPFRQTPVSDPFLNLQLPSSGQGDAVAFYNASHTGLREIVDDLDILRDLKTRQQQPIWEKLQASLAGRSTVTRLFIHGKAGSGKSITLNRVAVRLLRNNVTVLRCDPYFVDSTHFATNLLHALQNVGGPTVIIFDDVYKLQARGIDVASLSSDVFADDRLLFPALFILADNWSTRRGFNPLNQGVLGPNDHLAMLSDLIIPEIEALLDKLVDAERSGAIKEMAQLAPRSTRLSLVMNANDRVIAHVLLKLRYGKQIGELLRDEYESLADEAAKTFYRTVVLLGALDVGAPHFVAAHYRKLVAADFAVARFEQLYFEREPNEFRIRHSILQKTLTNVLFPDRDSRGAALIGLLTKLDLDKSAERDFVIDLLASGRLSQKVHELFERNTDRTERFVHDLEVNASVFEDAELGALLFAFIGTVYKDVLSLFDEAETAFERAYQLDADNPYVLRQRAWTAFRRGDLVCAESRAREAVSAWPKDVLTVSQSAFVLSCCSAEGFDTASELYREINPAEMTSDVRRRWECFQEAEVLVRHTGEFASSDVLQALRAPSFVWRARKHAVAAVGRQMFRELAGALADDRNIELDSDIVDENNFEFKDKALRSDRRLLGLLKGNVARFQYEKLRDFGKESIDIEKVEETFKAALNLYPDEPFIVCWYGTFLKDAKGDYKNAEVYYRRALTLSRSARQDWIKNHPIFENNLALLFMDGVYKQIYPSAYLKRSYNFLLAALRKMENGEGRFNWPVISMEQLKAQASEFSEPLPGDDPVVGDKADPTRS